MVTDEVAAPRLLVLTVFLPGLAGGTTRNTTRKDEKQEN